MTRLDKNTVKILGRKVYFCHTQKRKNAPKIVMLHGYGGNHRGLIDLADRMKQFDIVLVDLPGHGFSEPLKKKHTLENYAHFLKEFLETIELDRPHIVGHSLGGSISTVFAGKYPDRLEKLSLITPVILSNNWIVQAARAYYEVADMLPSDIGRHMLDNKFILYVTHSIVMMTRDAKKRREVLQRNYLSYKHTAAPTLVQSYLSYFTSPLLEYAKSITAQTLILCAGKDYVAPPDSVKLLAAAIPNNEFVLMKNAGHLMPLETPEKVARRIRNFLQQ